MIRINLLPVRAAKKKESQRFQLTVSGLVIFFVVALLAVVYITANSEANSAKAEVAKGEAELAGLKAKIGELSRIKAQKKVVEEKLGVIKSLETGRTGPTELLRKISIAIPEKAWLESFQDQGHLVILKGYAATDDVVADFMRGLEKFGELGSVELDVAQRVTEKETGADVVHYIIRFEKR